MNPKFPIYIPSKGRADSRLTVKALHAMNVPFSVVIEEQEYTKYSAVIPKENLLVLDKKYQDDYDTFDDLGSTKSKGPGAARNFAWEHSMSLGFEWHWVMDDNISAFYSSNKNRIVKCSDSLPFLVMEDFALRYKNIGMAGPNYEMFVPRIQKNPPLIFNTRIYSCNLIRNDIPYRWRGRYNEDTDLSLRMLKDGWCTVQFNTFLQKKMTTQLIKGGNTADFYAHEGTIPKSRMLVEMHTDVSTMLFKFGRWHHHVDYSQFKKNKLILKSDIEIPKEPKYKMKLVSINV